MKLFHKQFLLLIIFFAAGCATDINTGISAEVVNPEITEREIIESPEEHVFEKDKLPVEESEVIISETEIDWTDPESEKISPLLFLPVLPPEDKVLHEYEISELLYKHIFYDNDNFGWNEIYFIETIPQSENDTNSEAEQEPVKNSSNLVVENEVIPKTVYSERTIRAYVKEKTDILLNGKGWIYLPDDENNSLEYIGRKFTVDDTIYTFLPALEKDYTLRFQYQNLNNNIITIEIINLNIVKYYSASNIIEAEVEINSENAAEEESLDFKSSVSNMLVSGDVNGLSGMIPEVLESTDFEIRNMLPEIIELLYDNAFYVPARTLLEDLLNDSTFKSYFDYYLYLLGKIYEQDSQIQNEIISASYYKMLVDSYPASIYWDEARDRYRFLKRRYIDIR